MIDITYLRHKPTQSGWARDWIQLFLEERDQVCDELESLRLCIEHDRSAVADGVTTLKKVLAQREGLQEGRGPYEWDDERYQSEFVAAYIEIRAALEPLAKMAADWSNCPMTAAEVAKARRDLQAENESLRQAAANAPKEIRRFKLQDGPSVPWEAIEPHDAQCQRNHGGQTLEHIASRGGLSVAEFWYVMNDRKWSYSWKEEKANENGLFLANQINERYERFAQALANADELAKFQDREIATLREYGERVGRLHAQVMTENQSCQDLRADKKALEEMADRLAICASDDLLQIHFDPAFTTKTERALREALAAYKQLRAPDKVPSVERRRNQAFRWQIEGESYLGRQTLDDRRKNPFAYQAPEQAGGEK